MPKSKFLILILIFVGFSFLFAGFQYDEDHVQDEIARINTEIELLGLKWRAGKTSLSGLSSEEFRQMLGYWVPFYEDPEKYAKIEERAEIQAVLDWRTKDGGNYMTVVKHQGSCGSCWAFATLGTMEAMYNIEKGLYETRPALLAKKAKRPQSGLDFSGSHLDLYERKINQSLRYKNIFEQDLFFSYGDKANLTKKNISSPNWKLNLYERMMSQNLRYPNLSIQKSAFPFGKKADNSLGNVDYPCESLDLSGRIFPLALSIPDFSEQDLVSCSGAGDCSGGSTSQAASYIKNNGVVTDDCFSYTALDDTCDLCSDWTQKLSRIADWGWVTQTAVNEILIKNALQDGPIVFYMDVYSDFKNYTGGIYELTPSATYEGGHAIVLVGYDEENSCWICKNSWGTSWGENGYFRIKMGECETGKWVLKLWGVTISNQPPVLVELDIGDRTFEEGTEFTIQLQASDPELDSLTYSASPIPSGATFNTSTGLFTWKPSHTQHGEYTIRFSVTDGIFEDFEIVTIRVVNVKKGKGRF